jgi:putative ABC transport system permease protein
VIRLAASNLWRRRLRTALTVLGVVIGTASVIVMVALGLGNMEQFNKDFIQNANLTEIQILSVKGEGVSGPKLNDSSLETIKQIPGVVDAAAILDIPLLIRIGKYEADMMVQAMDASFLKGLEMDKGSLFTSETAPELVLDGNTLANCREEGDTEWWRKGNREAPDIDWLNQRLEIHFGGKSLLNADTDGPKPRVYRGRIAGYTKADEMNEKSYRAYMNLEVAKKMLRDNYKHLKDLGLEMNRYTSALIIAQDIDRVMPVLETLKEMGFDAYSPIEYIERAKKEQRRQQGQLSMVAVISLVVSALGIANTMLTSIMERRSEIGVMKVVGLSLARIRLVYLMEAAMIGLAGGLAGSLVGYMMAFIVGSSTGETVILGMYFGEGAKLVIPIWLTLTAVASSAGVGVLSGLYPAWKATKMSPLEAMRSGI